MNVKSSSSLVAVFILITLAFAPPADAGFTFAQPEINLVESTFQSFAQTNVHAAIDADGNAHAVWEDPREGPGKIYGTTVLPNRYVFNSYSVYEGVSTSTYFAPCIMTMNSDPEHLKVMGASMDTPPSLILSDYDISTLPLDIDPQDVSDYLVTPVGSIIDLDAVSWGYNQFFVFIYDGSIYYGLYDGLLTNWTLSGTISPGTNEEYSMPHLAMDSDGYIYMSFNRLNTLSGLCELIARRSIDPHSLVAGFASTDRSIDNAWSSIGFLNAITVIGTAGNLRVSVVYINPTASLPPTYCRTDTNGDWFSMTAFNGIRTQANSGGGTSVTGVDCLYDPAGRLYVVWNDNRTSGHRDIYGSVSYDFGLTFEYNTLLVSNNTTTLFGPDLALGYHPGQIAVSYARVKDGFQDPFMLLSSAEFYDACDDPPSTLWDGYSGVEIDNSLYHGATGAGSSYRLVTETAKGMLIRNYGIIEQQGVVELYFYDSMTTDADFSINLNNDNLKGVIRMLGVRNETTQYNYSYYNGTDWIDSGGTRSAGWHHVVMTVNDTGVDFELELTPWSSMTYSDSVFTSFTSLEIEGGSDSDPYNVDDIQIEVTALPVSPQYLPVDGPAMVLIALMMIGLMIARFRL